MNNPRRILLAEDDAFLIGVYAAALRKSGYHISVASDGELTLARIKNLNPDLLLIDAGLPKINGVSVLKTVRQDLELAGLKVVMLSNFNQQEEIKDSIDLKVDSYFSKAEHTAEEIVQEIKRILS